MTEVDFAAPVTDITVQLPVVPVGWRILIRPYEAPRTKGDIVLTEDTLESEDLLTYIGQIVAMGSACYTAVTRSGIDLSKIDPKPKVGDWIMYGTYGGQNILTTTGAKYMIMNDDGIMGIVPDPSVFRAYI